MFPSCEGNYVDIVCVLSLIGGLCLFLFGMMDAGENTMNAHEALISMKQDGTAYSEKYPAYAAKYALGVSVTNRIKKKLSRFSQQK